jgi:hypothetical protein
LTTRHEFTVPVSSDPDDPFGPLYKEGVVVDPNFARDGEIWRLPAASAQAPAPKLRVPKRQVREWAYEHRLALMNIAWTFVVGIMFGGFVLAAKAGVTPNAITPGILRPDKVQTAPVHPESSVGPIQQKTDRSDVLERNGHSATPKPSGKATASSSPSASTTSSPSASASSSTSASASPEVSDTPDTAATTPPSEPTPSASETSTTSTTSAPAEPEAPETPVSPSTAATPAVGVDEASSPSPS